MDVHGDCPVLQSIYLGRYSFEGTKDGVVSKESNLVLLSRIRKRLAFQTFPNCARLLPL